MAPKTLHQPGPRSQGSPSAWTLVGTRLAARVETQLLLTDDGDFQPARGEEFQNMPCLPVRGTDLFLLAPAS